MEYLPKWVLTNRFPSVYDSESATCIEQTARLYGAMQSLIEEYNQFAENVNSVIDTFVDNSETDQAQFKAEITKIMHNYIQSIDIKINDAINYMKTNIEDTTSKIVGEGIESGLYRVGVAYDPETETISLIAESGE